MQYTNNVRLKKPAQTDGYNVDDHNYNYDILDTQLKSLDDRIGGIKIPEINLIDSKIKITDLKSKFYATKLDGVLDEMDDRLIQAKSTADNAVNRANEALSKVGGITLTANKVSYTDTYGIGRSNVQTAINKVATRLTSIETEVGSTITELNSANNTLENDVGNPV